METKLIINFTIPGRKMLPYDQCKKENLAHRTVYDGKKIQHFTIRKNIPARQVLNINDSTYEYWVSENVPSNFIVGTETYSARVWKRKSQEERLKWYIEGIAHDLGGILESYKINDQRRSQSKSPDKS